MSTVNGNNEIVVHNWDRVYTASYHPHTTHPITGGFDYSKVTASWSDGSHIKVVMSPGSTFTTVDGTYRITYHNGPLSGSVAGGTSYKLKFPDGTEQSVFFPPGYSSEKLSNYEVMQLEKQKVENEIRFADAIADAKNVRQQALDDAKAALEEAFPTPLKPNTVKQKSNSVDEQFNRYAKQLGRDTVGRDDRTAPRRKNSELENFKSKLANMPKHLSYEGSVVLCVLLSMKDVATTNMANLPMVDQALIKSLLPTDITVNKETFEVKFDSDKDFILEFSIPPIYRSTEDSVKLNMFNSVAHPRPEDLGTAGVVPVEKDGDKIEVGGRIVLNRRGIEKLIGVDNNRTPKGDVEEETPKRQPVAGRNAFEIRTDVMQMALDYATHSKSHLTPEEIVNVARKFYAFVENKR